MSRIMHRAFDRMMDAPSAAWKRDDVVGDGFFDEIEDVLGKAPFVRTRLYANKLLLHAPDGFSCGASSIDGPTLNDIWTCQRAIVSVANRVSIAIGGSNLGDVPTAQFDVLENWSAPFAPEATFAEMMATWRRANEERSDWTQDLLS